MCPGNWPAFKCVDLYGRWVTEAQITPDRVGEWITGASSYMARRCLIRDEALCWMPGRCNKYTVLITGRSAHPLGLAARGQAPPVIRARDPRSPDGRRRPRCQP